MNEEMFDLMCLKHKGTRWHLACGSHYKICRKWLCCWVLWMKVFTGLVPSSSVIFKRRQKYLQAIFFKTQTFTPKQSRCVKTLQLQGKRVNGTKKSKLSLRYRGFAYKHINRPFLLLQTSPAHTAMLKSIWTTRTRTELTLLKHRRCLPLGLVWGLWSLETF